MTSTAAPCCSQTRAHDCICRHEQCEDLLFSSQRSLRYSPFSLVTRLRAPHNYESFRPQPPQYISRVPGTASPSYPFSPSPPISISSPDSVPSRESPAPRNENQLALAPVSASSELDTCPRQPSPSEHSPPSPAAIQTPARIRTRLRSSSFHQYRRSLSSRAQKNMALHFIIVEKELNVA